MLKKYQQRRLPIYLGGFLLGAAGVLMLSRVKNAMAPDFRESLDQRPLVALAPGGQLRLTLGEEPGHVLAWGFPTQLMVGKQGEGGMFQPVMRMEYRDLVEKETLVGPFDAAGTYELRAQFFACDYPGEKYCAKVMLVQPVSVRAGAPAELPLSLDVKALAVSAAAAGAGAARP